MSSRKLQALDFIKRYFADWGRSPTLGELAAELGVSNKRAHDLVDKLAEEHMIEREAGKTRGIRLIDRGEELSEADVLLLLSARGWTIGRGNRMVLPPESELGVAITRTLTEKGLHALPVLDHEPAEPSGAGAAPSGKTDQARAGARSAAAAARTSGGKPDRMGQAAP